MKISNSVSNVRTIPLIAMLNIAAFALPGVAARGQGASNSALLPVKQVTIFTSGVSYTERAGTIDGDAEVPLSFRTMQINDILKSMVLLDQGGKVQPATYGSRDPINRALKAFAIDVSDNISRADLLKSIRGAKIAILQDNLKQPVATGQIVSVEERDEATTDSKEIRPTHNVYVNLLTEAGLSSIKLDATKSLKLLDERLDKEFHEALNLLATGTDDQRRQVKLHFAGAGKRAVRVGYVTESPIWKITYRLVLGAGNKPYLQGWALVENATDEDWNGVQLSLVSGRPVSFIQDLYQPLYIRRPIVQPDIVASPLPQTHDSGIVEQQVVALAKSSPMDPTTTLSATRRKSDRQEQAGDELADKLIAGVPGGGGFGGGTNYAFGGVSGKRGALSAELRQSVDAAASGERAGELFQYTISSPLTLKRQESAMIPVIAQDIESDKVSLFSQGTGSRFALNAVRIKNTTGLHLKGGPVTLFDAGVYAGDARMEDVAPTDSRLITYAVDLETEVDAKAESAPSTETSVSIQKGVLVVTSRQQLETVYTVKVHGDKQKHVLIEHPIIQGFTLDQAAKPAEQTASLYRFDVNVAAGKSETLKVVTARPLEQRFGMVDTDIDMLMVYSNRKTLPEKLRNAIQEIVLRRRKVVEMRAQVATREAEIGAISTDQERIRKNMEALDKNSALYKRYVSELDTQETHLEQLRREAASLRINAENADRELKVYVGGISM